MLKLNINYILLFVIFLILFISIKAKQSLEHSRSVYPAKNNFKERALKIRGNITYIKRSGTSKSVPYNWPIHARRKSPKALFRQTYRRSYANAAPFYPVAPPFPYLPMAQSNSPTYPKRPPFLPLPPLYPQDIPQSCECCCSYMTWPYPPAVPCIPTGYPYSYETTTIPSSTKGESTPTQPGSTSNQATESTPATQATSSSQNTLPPTSGIPGTASTTTVPQIPLTGPFLPIPWPIIQPTNLPTFPLPVIQPTLTPSVSAPLYSFPWPIIQPKDGSTVPFPWPIIQPQNGSNIPFPRPIIQPKDGSTVPLTFPWPIIQPKDGSAPYPFPWPIIQPKDGSRAPFPWPIIQPKDGSPFSFPWPIIQPKDGSPFSFPWPIIQPKDGSTIPIPFPWPIIQPKSDDTKPCCQVTVNSCPNTCNCNNPCTTCNYNKHGSMPASSYAIAPPAYGAPSKLIGQPNNLAAILGPSIQSTFPSNSPVPSSTAISDDDDDALIPLQTSTEDETLRTKIRRDHPTTASSENSKVIKKQFAKITSNFAIVKEYNSMLGFIPVITSLLMFMLSPVESII